MHPLLVDIKNKLGAPEDILKDSLRILGEYDNHVVAKHTEQVALKSTELAIRFFNDIELGEKAKIAGALHDLSAVIPNELKIEVAETLEIEILNEEREFPLIIHQKLSSEIARLVFGVKDMEILSAIQCHTTLRENPSNLDMLLFISDKINWDQNGSPPYIDLVKNGLNKSLKEGVFAFVKYLYDDRQNLKIIHPWLIDAYNYLKS